MNECLPFSCWMKGIFHIVWRYQTRRLKSMFFFWFTIYDNVYMKWLDCVYDVDRSISAKKNRMEKNEKVDDVCSFVIIKTNLTELDRNIVSLLCSWNKVAHFKENRVCKFVASLYSVSTAFILILLCVCVYMCMSVCVCISVCVCLCVCLQAFISFHSKGLFLSKVTSETCTRQTNISWFTSVNSPFLHINIQNS